jgi:hypothetical protein
MELKNKTEQEIKEIFKPGKTFYIAGNKCHVVNYTFDGNIELIVVKSWNKFRNRWCYDVWRFKEIFYEVDVLYGYVRFSKHKRKRS